MSSMKQLNNNSCWTCRLRHKKCDEGLPSCATCERWEITCYHSNNNGKPEFMDGGEKEKQMSIEISAAIKAKNDSQRRSRALEAIAKRRRQWQLQSQETTTDSYSSQKYTRVSAGKVTRSEMESLQVSVIADSNSCPSAAASNLQSIPSNLKNQVSRDPAPSPVVSCENWVKVLIDEIRTSRKQKGQDQLSNHASETNGFHSKANELQNHLKEGLLCLTQKYAKLTKTTHTPDRTEIQPAETEAETHLQRMEIWITTLYIHAALIYLHITFYSTDSQAHSTINKMVFEWTFTFRFLPDAILLPNLVWPLCITGCMAATANQQQFFRNTVTSSGIDCQSPCMIWRALEIMEKCWETSVCQRMQIGDLEWMEDLDGL